jgi:hypothetical protein
LSIENYFNGLDVNLIEQSVGNYFMGLPHIL